MFDSFANLKPRLKALNFLQTMGIFVFVRVSKKLQLVRNDSSFMSNSHKTHLLPLSNHASTSFLFFHFRQKVPYLEWEKFYLEVFNHYK